MVRILTERAFTEDGKRYIESAGLSTDTKPDNVVTGSSFIEVDTSKVYIYNEDAQEWAEL